MDAKEQNRELERKLADLKARWPAHSVPPSMWRELEELEEALEQLKSEAKPETDAKQDRPG